MEHAARLRQLAAAFGLMLALVRSDAGAQTLPFEVFSLKEGLPQSQVGTLAQDREGYLWVGTWGGLARFNGERFDSFYLADGLPSNRIQELLVTRGGLLWVATTAGLSLWSDHHLSVLADPLVAGARCRALAEDTAGRLWVGTDRGLLRRDGARFVAVADATGQSVGTVYGLLADGDGVLAVTNRGMFQAGADGPAKGAPTPSVRPETLRSIQRTAEGLWVGTNEQGLFLLQGDRWTRIPSATLPARYVSGLQVGRSGTLYVASQDAGLFLRGSGQNRFERLSSANGLPSDVVNSAFEDTQGNLWVATDIGGLARLRRSGVLNYGRREGLPHSCVFSMCGAGRPGEMWLATLGGGARIRVEPEFHVLETLTTRDGLAEDRVWKIEITPGGETWVMTDTAFSVRVPGARRCVPLPRALAIPRGEVHDVTVDGEGRVWLAGEDPAASLAVRDRNGVWRHWSRTDAGVSLPRCRIVARRRAGGVWVTADDRILQGDGVTLHELSPPPPLGTGIYLGALLEDSKGRLWAGNDAGLALRESDGSWRRLDGLPGFASHQVYSIGEDRDGVIWVGTGRGAFRFGADDRVRPFSIEHGLAGLETNEDGFFAAPDGSVWIGTVDGASRIDPRALVTSAVAPPLRVEAVDLPGRHVLFPVGLDLGWSERNLTFHVAVLAFGGERRGRYRARLQGMEPDWLPMRPAGELRYTNLLAGSHHLLLQAARDDGGWGETVVLPVRVRPPFWQTSWFRALVALTLAAGMLTIHRRRTRVLRQRAAELESRVAERTRALSEANRRLEEAQEKIARLVETSDQAQEDLPTWSQAMARDIARAIGAREIAVFRVDEEQSVPVTQTAVVRPSSDEIRRAALSGAVRSEGQLLLPITGAAGEVRGALVVLGEAGTCGEAEMRLLRGFAHQLGGALEMSAMRERLSQLEQARATLRREMQAQGISTVAVCPSCGRCYQASENGHCPEDDATLDTRLLIPFRIRNRYRLVRILGQGGMGTVFLAEDEQLAREVAIKVLRPERFDDTASRLRFEREAQVLAHIPHPGVTALFDAGHLDDGSAFLIMERLRGCDLATLIAHHGAGRPDQVASLLRQAGAALSAAHAAGILHRDLKPQNLVLCEAAAGFAVKLVDFGIAKPLAETDGLTLTGLVIGTPAYMSPEQAASKPLTVRSDLYSLAAVCFEALSGRRIVGGTRIAEVFSQILTGSRPRLGEVVTGVSPELDAAFAEALAREPERRPQNVGTWVDTVARLLERLPASVTGWPSPLPVDESASFATPRPTPSGDLRSQRTV